MNNSKAHKVLPVLLIAILLFQGCVPMPTRRDFRRMFSTYSTRIGDNPIIIVPGILGSRLVNVKTERVEWGSLELKPVRFLSEVDGLALPIDALPLSENRDNVSSQGVVDKIDIPLKIIQFTVYKELLDMLEELGYNLGDIKNPKPENNLYVFDYDWRRDNVESAALLAERIENIKKVTGRPNQKFNLICHSMGGLVGRYYVRYGGKDVLGQAPDFKVTFGGAKNIKKLILIGVPNLGSMPVFRFVHEGMDLRVVRYPPYAMFTMPSVYQLLPFGNVKSFVDKDGGLMDVSIYDIENWKKFGWSMYSQKMLKITESRYRSKFKETWEREFGKFEAKRDRFVEAALARAALFQQALNFRSKKKSPCDVVLFGGDTEWTVNRAILKKDKHGRWQTSFRGPHMRDKILAPGDNMITRESLLGTPVAGITRRGWKDSPMDISFALFVTRKHENIHKDPTFQDNLLHILLGDYY